MDDSQQSSQLHEAGLKATQARICILRLFEQEPALHLSAEDVYRRLVDAGEEVGLATVYRVLSQFEEAGLMIRHKFEEGRSVYERAAGQHHDHMVDLENGKIIEFVDDEIEALQTRIADQHGYDIVSHSMVMFVRPKKPG